MTHAASIALSGSDENSDDVPKEMSVRRKTGAKACSMRHQDRNRYGSEDFSRHTPQDELPQPRMTVAAHDQEIGRAVRRVREDGAGHVGLGGDDAFELHRDAMTRQMLGYVGPRHFIALGRLAGDGHNLGYLGAPQKRERVGGGARRAAAH